MTPACERLRPAIEALLEGALEDDAALAAEVGEHLEGCAACQGAAGETTQLRGLLADVIPMPPADVWRVFDDELQERLADTAPERAGRPLRLGVFGPLLAAAAGLLLLLGVFAVQTIEPTVTIRGLRRVPVYSLDYVDPAWKPRQGRDRLEPSAVEGLAEAAASLTPAAHEALSAHGLVQVPSRSQRLADLYPLAPRPGDPPPLATADASLLLAGAVSSRAALALEAELLAPGLRALLDHTQRELRGLEVGARDAVARRAVRRAREHLGVAALLVGVDPRLPPDSAARAGDEVGYLLRGAPYVSPLLGREIDARAVAPRGQFAAAPALHGHARAAAWLSLTGLTLDAAHADDVRAAGMIALALASGRGERRTALDLQARLEAALEVLYGEPDGLTPLDMVEVLRQGLGVEALTPSALAAPGAVERLVERAAIVAAARGEERVGPPGAPTFRLLGGARSLEGLALTRLSPPALERPRPTSVDLLVLLGSRRARTVVSALDLDAPGYDAAVAALGQVAAAWTDASRPVPARTCLEQGRLWAVAALVAPDAGAAGPASPGVMTDRLLLAGLAALNAPPPSPEPWLTAGGERPADAGPIPLVEPLPRLHARLAFTAERLARVLDDLAPPGGATPRVRAAAAALRRVARLEAALRDASLDALEGRAPAPSTAAALRDFAPALRALGPDRATSAEDVYVQRRTPDADTGADGAVRVLHRVVHALDRLLLVVIDPVSRRPVLAAGAALSVHERWTDGARLNLHDDRPGAAPGDLDPPWAVHVVRR